MPLDAVVSLLQCSRCAGEMVGIEESVQCIRCGATSPVVDGVPVLAQNDAGRTDRHPLLYDAAQFVLGGRRSRARVGAMLAALSPSSVLDVGGGTGFYAPAVPAYAHYVVADTDIGKIRRLRQRHARADAVLADATALPVRSNAVDVALFIAVAHHLPDEALNRALSELARVARQRVLFVDPLASSRLTARALWRLDRGSSPRSSQELVVRAAAWFELEHVEIYSILHDYVLWVGTPHASHLP
jgi:SAM-dependent methyltransferase